MKCANCGAELKAKDTVCPECATPVTKGGKVAKDTNKKNTTTKATTKATAKTADKPVAKTKKVATKADATSEAPKSSILQQSGGVSNKIEKDTEKVGIEKKEVEKIKMETGKDNDDVKPKINPSNATNAGKDKGTFQPNLDILNRASMGFKTNPTTGGATTGTPNAGVNNLGTIPGNTEKSATASTNAGFQSNLGTIKPSTGGLNANQPNKPNTGFTPNMGQPNKPNTGFTPNMGQPNKPNAGFTPNMGQPNKPNAGFTPNIGQTNNTNLGATPNAGQTIGNIPGTGPSIGQPTSGGPSLGPNLGNLNKGNTGLGPNSGPFNPNAGKTSKGGGIEKKTIILISIIALIVILVVVLIVVIASSSSSKKDDESNKFVSSFVNPSDYLTLDDGSTSNNGNTIGNTVGNTIGTGTTSTTKKTVEFGGYEWSIPKNLTHFYDSLEDRLIIGSLDGSWAATLTIRPIDYLDLVSKELTDVMAGLSNEETTSISELSVKTINTVEYAIYQIDLDGTEFVECFTELDEGRTLEISLFNKNGSYSTNALSFISGILSYLDDGSSSSSSSNSNSVNTNTVTGGNSVTGDNTVTNGNSITGGNSVSNGNSVGNNTVGNVDGTPLDVKGPQITQLYDFILKYDDTETGYVVDGITAPASFYKDTVVTRYNLDFLSELIAVLKSYGTNVATKDKAEVESILSSSKYFADIPDFASVKVYENLEQAATKIFGYSTFNWKDVRGTKSALIYLNNTYYLVDQPSINNSSRGLKKGLSVLENAVESDDYIYIFDKFVWLSEDEQLGITGTEDMRLNIYASSSETVKLGVESFSNTPNISQLISKYSDKLNTYKHTFQKGTDGTYSWVSTEPVF